MNPLDDALDTIARPLRGLSGLARLQTGLATAVAILALAAWLVRGGWLAAPEWVLVAWVLIGASLAVSLIAARHAIAVLGPREVGARLEASGAWRRGALTTVLDAPATGTSEALHRAAAARGAADVRVRGGGVLATTVARQRRAARRAAAGLTLALIALLAARPASGAPARLWHPIGAWRALVAPVRLSARALTVARGEPAVLDVSVAGHRSATLFTRAPGEAWHASALALDNNGNATVTTAPLVADLVAKVEAGGRKSGEVRVGIRLAAFLGAFTAFAHYPAYLGVEDESLPTTGDTLVLPEGTRLDVAGRATTALTRARLIGAAGDVALLVNGTGFRGAFTPRQSGLWRLVVARAGGGVLDGELPALPVRIVADSAPVVEIPVPGADTIAALSMSLALVVAIRDDHGIRDAALETRLGASGVITRIPLALPPATVDRALITTALDLAKLGLRPGDTLHYAATADDNAPRRHSGRSREFVLRIPTEAEQRAARARQTAETATGFDSLSSRAARVQRLEEDLARERQRADPKAAGARPDAEGQKAPLASETARKAEAVAQAQQRVFDDAVKLRRSVAELREGAERQSGADSALAHDLDEINRLLATALAPELRDKLDALRQAVNRLDADATRQALQDLSTRQAQLKQAMDQARDLFRRAALETSLANMARDASQLAGEQHAASGTLARGDSGRGAKLEADLAHRADSLGAGLDRAAQQVPAAQTREGLQQSGKESRDAAGKMRQAATASQTGRTSDAESQAKQAEDQLNRLSKQIDDDRRKMQAEMRAEVKQALDRALAETARLAEHQFAVAEDFRQGALLPQTRVEQGLVEEGAAKLMQQVAAVAAMNALVSPQTAVALSEARRLMREAVGAVASANPSVRDAAEKSGDAVDALAVAAFTLMQSKDKVDGSQSGSGVQEAMEQMKQMAGRQGQLAQQGAGMMQNGQMNAQQLMQMALQQRALALQLERMRAGGQLPGAGQMAREAKDLSTTLEGGRLNQDVVDRAQKLFKRMLDAGRTLQGQEDDENKERQSTTANDIAPGAPPALDPRIRTGAGEIRLPSWESMQRLSPEERRRVVDYFQRLTQGRTP